ncbi:MAG: transcriptional regulator [Candidatus Thorarchaeota archaeon]
MTKERNQLLEQVKTELADAGFLVSSDCDVRPSCFDIVARKDDQLVLVKVLANVGALTNQDASALKRVAGFFNAVPLVIGNKTQRGQLEDNTVYKRYGITTITTSILRRVLRSDELPMEYVQRGGRFVTIDSVKLRETRTVRRMTKEDLAECVNVSARAILAYEKNEIDVSVEVAERLEKVLETDLIIPIDPLRASLPDNSPLDSNVPQEEELSYIERKVTDFLGQLGMTVLWTNRAPFHIAARERGPPILSGIGSIRNPGFQRRTEILKSVSEVTESDAVLIVEDQDGPEMTDLPVVYQQELEEIDEPTELKRILSERLDG